jgi:quinol---cytochrome-c reductase cytochrome c subunit
MDAMDDEKPVVDDVDLTDDARDEQDDSELSFEPAVADVPRRPRRAGGRNWRVRAAAVTTFVLALLGTGTAFAFASSSSASTGSVQGNAERGRQLYSDSCITCHGRNLEGIKGMGIPIVGVGQSAVYFQVSTGRMPLAGQGTEAVRKPQKFDEQQTLDLAAYIQSVGGGPTLPKGSLRTTMLGQGGELFRLNCAACHNFVGRGGALSAGKNAPDLYQATDKQIYTAMQTGPENMPVFSDNEITPQQKKEILSYIQTQKASKDPGGVSLGRVGPAAEGIMNWVVGVGTLMIFIIWIAARRGRGGA